MLGWQLQCLLGNDYLVWLSDEGQSTWTESCHLGIFPALGRQKQVDLLLHTHSGLKASSDQPGLHRETQKERGEEL